MSALSEHRAEPPSITDSSFELLQTIANRLEALESASSSRSRSNTEKKKTDTKSKTKAKIETTEKKAQTPTPAQSLIGTASIEQIPQHPETTSTLAKRWRITPKTLTRQRQRYENKPEDFFKYSLNKEQGKFGWIYDPEQMLFYAVTEFTEFADSGYSPNLESKQPEAIPTEFPSPPKPLTLTLEQLAQRFTNPRTGKPLSPRAIQTELRRVGNSDKFAAYCRLRDQDGLAWTYNHDDNLFISLG
jgi:hypothetical protein